MNDDEETNVALRLFCEKLQRIIEKRIERYEERMIFQWQHFEEMQQNRFELMERRIFEKIEGKRERVEEKKAEEKKGSSTKTPKITRSEEDIRKDKEIARLHRAQIDANLQKSVNDELKRVAPEVPKNAKFSKIDD